jgi:hypothetical protein
MVELYIMEHNKRKDVRYPDLPRAALAPLQRVACFQRTVLRRLRCA